jgi:hypothetical protein
MNAGVLLFCMLLILGETVALADQPIRTTSAADQATTPGERCGLVAVFRIRESGPDATSTSIRLAVRLRQFEAERSKLQDEVTAYAYHDLPIPHGVAAKGDELIKKWIKVFNEEFPDGKPEVQRVRDFLAEMEQTNTTLNYVPHNDRPWGQRVRDPLQHETAF